MRRWNAALLLVVLAIQSWAGDVLPGNLCTKAETAYFSCPVKNQQQISLCGALPRDLQYRFGTPEQVEFRYPENTQDGPRNLRLAHYSRYQTELVEVSFQNQDVDYTLFDYLEDAHRSAGVRVITGDGQEHEIRCVGQIVGSLGVLGSSLPCDADNALTGGLCPQMEGVE